MNLSTGSNRVLDPLERFSEIVFGLIMVLSFTCAFSVAEAGREDVRAMLIGALGVFLLVFLSTFPVVIPFIFLHEAHLALRISNGIAILLLFGTGHMLAGFAGLRRIRTGLAMVAIGAVLVALTIALGG